MLDVYGFYKTKTLYIIKQQYIKNRFANPKLNYLPVKLVKFFIIPIIFLNEIIKSLKGFFNKDYLYHKNLKLENVEIKIPKNFKFLKKNIL